jgi:16S rRNA (guanine527-N7)-methyltransferase
MANLLLDPARFDDKTLQKLRDLETLLRKWNKNINLVSETDEVHLWDRHIVDSLQLIPYLRDVNKLADMGSGPGLPSVPLAIACPDIDVFAIEPKQKQAALMAELIREIRIPNLHVLGERVEKVFLSHMDVVCCRAFGEFSRDARLAYKMLKPGGAFMTFKTAEETVVPQGYEKIENHGYQLVNNPRRYNIVIAYKTGEM